jgi:hypothetical protein
MFVNDCAGRLFSHVQTMKLEAKWQQKKLDFITLPKEDGKTKKNNSANFLQNNDFIKKTLVQRAELKMKSGKKLTRDEMEFLKTHAPDMYIKALKIEKEREEYRKALQNCRTKEDVKRVQAVKAMQLQEEADAIPNKNSDSGRDTLEFIAMRLAAMLDEFSDFVKSGEYDELPEKSDSEDEEQIMRKPKKKGFVLSYEICKPEGNKIQIKMKGGEISHNFQILSKSQPASLNSNTN